MCCSLILSTSTLARVKTIPMHKKESKVSEIFLCMLDVKCEIKLHRSRESQSSMSTRRRRRRGKRPSITACALQHNNFTPSRRTDWLQHNFQYTRRLLWCVQNNRRIYCIVEMEWNIKDKWRIFSEVGSVVEWKIIKEIICLVIAATVFFLLSPAFFFHFISLTWRSVRVEEKCVQRFRRYVESMKLAMRNSMNCKSENRF